MIISRDYAHKLIRTDKATESGLVHHGHDSSGMYMVIVDRYDVQRTDHYDAQPADIDRLRNQD